MRVKHNRTLQRRRKSIWVFVGSICCLLAACGDKVDLVPNPEPLSADQVNDARQAATKWIGNGGRALFVCGQSKGVGLFTEQWDKGFQADGIKDGRLVFLLRSDGTADIIFRDATGQYLSAVEDGGNVVRLSSGDKESWTIGYPETGVTETHNITAADEQLVDLWTSNKPTLMLQSSAKLFISGCRRA